MSIHVDKHLLFGKCSLAMYVFPKFLYCHFFKHNLFNSFTPYKPLVKASEQICNHISDHFSF